MKQRLILLSMVVCLGVGLGRDEMAAAESEEGTKISFYGYGEMHYNSPFVNSDRGGFPSTDDRTTMDFHRLVLGWGVPFNDRIRFQGEVEWEHAGQEIELEFGYLEFDLTPGLQARVGSLLMPVGDLNEFHEPTQFYSVERPYVQRFLIPTTWQEGGAGLVGSLSSGLNARVYYVTGLDASQFSSNNGLGEIVPLSEDLKGADQMAVVGRIEYVGLPGIQVGGSYYTGGASQRTENSCIAPCSSVVPKGVAVSLWDLDLHARRGPFEARGTYIMTHVSGTEDLSTALDQTIGEEMTGGMAEIALHTLPLLLPGTEQDLVLFGRIEHFNTQAKVAGGAAAATGPADEANDRRVITYGITYFPHRDVALKIDQERWRDGADQTGHRTNLGMAFMF